MLTKLRSMVQGLRAKLVDPLRHKFRRRVRSPTVLQMEAVECGAAALGIILAHHGRWVPLEELRLACGVSRDGSKASNMVKAARTYGLKAKGFKNEPKALRSLPSPMILHWNFNHFLVLDGFGSKGKVYLNDPGGGPRTSTDRELDESFTGVVLVFEPGPDFERRGRPPSLVTALLPRLRGTGPALALVILIGLILVVPNLVAPAFSKVFVDSILLESYLGWLRPLLVVMGLTAILIGVLTWLQLSDLLRLESRLSLSSASRFLWHVLRLPMEFFNQRFAGDLSFRVGLNDKVAQLLSGDLASNALAAVMVLFFVVVLFRYDPALTLVGIGIVSLNLAALRYVSRRRLDGNRRLLQEQSKLNGTALGGLQTIETLKATGREGDFFLRLSGYQTKVVNIRQELERYTQVLDTVPPLLSAINTAVILGLGSLRVIEGAMTLGGLVAFQALMASFIAPVTNLVNLGSKLQTAEGDLGRLDDVLRYQTEVPVNLEGASEKLSDLPVRLAGRLQINAITFGYSRLAPPLIKNFNLDVTPGSRVALVGSSGSGKSTIAHLVTGLYKPWQGEILFDGRVREETPRPVFNGSVASVDQNIFLFEGNVRDNLTLWDPTRTLPEVITAARDACIHDDIAARPGGYESPVDEEGANWSGGQQQRLEIARALVRNPSILVLDEATSALDSATEAQIDEALRRRGCTCLIIAHRLSTIRDADEILVMEQGKVVCRGSHDELIAEPDGPYARLIQES